MRLSVVEVERLFLFSTKDHLPSLYFKAGFPSFTWLAQKSDLNLFSLYYLVSKGSCYGLPRMISVCLLKLDTGGKPNVYIDLEICVDIYTHRYRYIQTHNVSLYMKLGKGQENKKLKNQEDVRTLPPPIHNLPSTLLFVGSLLMLSFSLAISYKFHESRGLLPHCHLCISSACHCITVPIKIGRAHV